MSDHTPPLDLTALRDIANAATEGEWWTRQFEPNVIDIFAGDGAGGNPGVAEAWHPEDARHIAAFDPPTVLALLDRLEAAEKQIAAVRELHRPVPVYTTEAGDCEHEGACEAVELSDGAFCPAHTDGLTCNACAQTGEHMDGLPTYPCPTIAALDGAK